MPVLKIRSRVHLMIVRKQGKQAIGMVRKAGMLPLRLSLLQAVQAVRNSLLASGFLESGKKSKGATLGQHRSRC
jgi:hypothetical protein